MNTNKTLIDKYLRKVISSKQFSKSKISCDLLSYLVNASLEGKNPKEYTIGVELFGKKYSDTEKQDSNIRVYIHNVRKKLTEYYENEGSKDPVVFVVEKGKYKVRFDSAKDHRKPKPKPYLIPFIISLIALVAVVYLLLSDTKRTENPWKDLPVWQEFAENEKSTLLVLGDYFVFNGQIPTGENGIFRDFSINSEVDYEHLLDKNPDLVKTISKSSLTYLSKMAVFCQSEIYKVFAQTGASIDVKLSSDLQPDDLKNNNIIFIGNYKNMGLFENLVKEMTFSFGVSSASNQLIYSSDPCTEIFRPESDNTKQKDYALMIKTKEFSGNHILLFLSAMDIGNISIVNQMTNPAYLKDFQKEQLQEVESEDFKALFKVDGINKTDLSFELIKVE
ncbi:hypothetical protein [Sunxiuqinia indica]|uniref:hypothetical protein n=1 Tax=Sunxiuqinia indica TaxID=2692584 RepID=UPI00135B0CCF|nr:hypothetical protein [Sunxiuqinia indica]